MDAASKPVEPYWQKFPLATVANPTNLCTDCGHVRSLHCQAPGDSRYKCQAWKCECTGATHIYHVAMFSGHL